MYSTNPAQTHQQIILPQISPATTTTQTQRQTSRINQPLQRQFEYFKRRLDDFQQKNERIIHKIQKAYDFKKKLIPLVNFDSFGQDTWEGQFDVRQGEQDAGQVQQDTSQVKQDWRQVQQPGQYGNMRNNLPVSVHHMDQGHQRGHIITQNNCSTAMMRPQSMQPMPRLQHTRSPQHFLPAQSTHPTEHFSIPPKHLSLVNHLRNSTKIVKTYPNNSVLEQCTLKTSKSSILCPPINSRDPSVIDSPRSEEHQFYIQSIPIISSTNEKNTQNIQQLAQQELGKIKMYNRQREKSLRQLLQHHMEAFMQELQANILNRVEERVKQCNWKLKRAQIVIKKIHSQNKLGKLNITQMHPPSIPQTYSQLQNTNKQLENSLKITVSENQRLAREVTELTKHLSLMQNKYVQITSSNHLETNQLVIEYQKEIREIHAELLTRNGEMGQLKCKNEELRDHNVRLIGSQDNDKQIITLLKDKLSQLEAMMETKKGIMATKEEEWMNLKVKLELTQTNLLEKQSQIYLLESRLRKTTCDLLAKETQLQQFQYILHRDHSILKELDEVSVSIDSVGWQNKTLQTKILELEAEVGETKHTLLTTEKKCTILCEQIEVGAREKDALKQINSTLQSKNQALIAKLMNCREQKQKQKCSKQQITIDALRQEIEQLQKKHTNAVEQLQSEKNENLNFLTQMIRLKAEVTYKQQIVEDLQTKLSKHKLEIENNREHTQNVESQLATLQGELVQSSTSHKQQIALLKHRIQELEIRGYHPIMQQESFASDTFFNSQDISLRRLHLPQQSNPAELNIDFVNDKYKLQVLERQIINYQNLIVELKQRIQHIENINDQQQSDLKKLQAQLFQQSSLSHKLAQQQQIIQKLQKEVQLSKKNQRIVKELVPVFESKQFPPHLQVLKTIELQKSYTVQQSAYMSSKFEQEFNSFADTSFNQDDSAMSEAQKRIQSWNYQSHSEEVSMYFHEAFKLKQKLMINRIDQQEQRKILIKTVDYIRSLKYVIHDLKEKIRQTVKVGQQSLINMELELDEDQERDMDCVETGRFREEIVTEQKQQKCKRNKKNVEDVAQLQLLVEKNQQLQKNIQRLQHEQQKTEEQQIEFIRIKQLLKQEIKHLSLQISAKKNSAEELEILQSIKQLIIDIANNIAFIVLPEKNAAEKEERKLQNEQYISALCNMLEISSEGKKGLRDQLTAKK